MLNRKYKIIIWTLFLALSAVILFLAIIRGNAKNQNISNNQAIIKNSGYNNDDIKYLRDIYPDTSEDEFNYYQKISKDGRSALEKCHTAKDERICEVAIAFFNQDKNFCHFHGTGEEGTEDEEIEKDCYRIILKKTIERDIGRCQTQDGDDYFNCLSEIFNIYDSISECEGLSKDKEKSICEDVFNYNAAYSEYDNILCDNVKDEKIKKYCLKNIIDKSQDTDGDGLTDLDEINIYRSHYLFFDTDNDDLNDGEEIKLYKTNPLVFDSDSDGYGDGDEVKNGFDPLK